MRLYTPKIDDYVTTTTYDGISKNSSFDIKFYVFDKSFPMLAEDEELSAQIIFTDAATGEDIYITSKVISLEPQSEITVSIITSDLSTDSKPIDKTKQFNYSVILGQAKCEEKDGELVITSFTALSAPSQSALLNVIYNVVKVKTNEKEEEIIIPIPEIMDKNQKSVININPNENEPQYLLKLECVLEEDDTQEKMFGVLERAIITIDLENKHTVYPKDRNIISAEIPLKAYMDIAAPINVVVEGFTSLGLKIEDRITVSLPSQNYTDNPATLLAKAKPNFAAIEVSLKATEEDLSEATLWRTSSKTGCHEWRPISTFKTITASSVERLIYTDNTAEAGIAYKYELRAGDKKYSMPNDTCCVLNYEDYYLQSNKYQVRIRYNPEVGNITFNTQDSLQNTIGSKYPLVTRNGLTRYRTFTIGGLLSFNAEQSSPDATSTDSRFFNTHPILDYDNTYYSRLSFVERERICEKIYRDKIIEFLNEDSVKLFKSFTEGNMLIKLQQIQLTPNKQLGRNIYSFSAKAIEVADFNLTNYKKYICNTEDGLKHETDYVLYTQGKAAQNVLWISAEDINTDEDGNKYLVLDVEN